MDYKSSLVSSKFQSGKCYISYFAIIQDLMFNCYEVFQLNVLDFSVNPSTRLVLLGLEWTAT
jgi:hypothetical protein